MNPLAFFLDWLVVCVCMMYMCECRRSNVTATWRSEDTVDLGSSLSGLGDKHFDPPSHLASLLLAF